MQTRELNIIWFVPLPLAILAEHQGIYEGRGLLVSQTLTRSSDQQFEALASGAADAAITAMDNVFLWNRRGIIDDLAIAAQMERTTPLALVARPTIERIEQLRGGALLVDSPVNGFVVVLRAMLQEAGIGVDEYRMLPAGGVRERFEALLAGEGDATLLGPPFDTGAVARGCTVLGSANALYPDFPGQGLVARKSVLTRKSPEFRTWLSMLAEARAWSKDNPAAALSLLANRGFPEIVTRAMLAAVPESFAVSRGGTTLLIGQRRKLGLPGADVDHETLVDERLFEASIP